jgi:hypothetical protein
MSAIGAPEPPRTGDHKPPKRNWRAIKPFCNLKLSHCVQIFLTISLLAVAYAQYRVYTRQEGIMADQAAILRAQQRGWIKVEIAVNDAIDLRAGWGIIPLQYTLTNVGHSPVFNVRVSASGLLEGSKMSI